MVCVPVQITKAAARGSSWLCSVSLNWELPFERWSPWPKRAKGQSDKPFLPYLRENPELRNLRKQTLVTLINCPHLTHILLKFLMKDTKPCSPPSSNLQKCIVSLHINCLFHSSPSQRVIGCILLCTNNNTWDLSPVVLPGANFINSLQTRTPK